MTNIIGYFKHDNGDLFVAIEYVGDDTILIYSPTEQHGECSIHYLKKCEEITLSTYNSLSENFHTPIDYLRERKYRLKQYIDEEQKEILASDLARLLSEEKHLVSFAHRSKELYDDYHEDEADKILIRMKEILNIRSGHNEN